MKDIKLPNPCLEVRDLRVALALNAAGTTAAAAAILHITQPAVSRALRSLEERLGTELFTRTSTGLVPTDTGERLLTTAPGLLAELCDLEQRLRCPSVPKTRIRLVCECHTAYHWVPSALTALRERMPDLELVLCVEHTADPIAALERGVIDAALVTGSSIPPGPFRERPLFSDELVFVVADSHHLAARQSLVRADLEQHCLIANHTPAAEASWFMRAVFGRRRPKLRFELFPLTEAIVEMTRAGMGIAVLTEWTASPHLERGGLVAKRLDSGPLRRPWRLAYRCDVEAVVGRLVTALQSTVPHPRIPH